MAVAGLLAGVPAAAQAAWLKGETEKFVVYTDGGERGLRDLVEQLSVFDYVLRLLHPTTTKRPSAAKFEVYLVRNTNQMRRLRPGAGEALRGYYKAAPGGVYAVAIRGDGPVAAEQVLFHEYTHRFMLENFPGGSYPAWLVEAYAEYYGAAVVGREYVDVGGANPTRATSLARGVWLPMDTLLSKSSQELNSGAEREMFYAQGWLLFHYMRSDPVRVKQLEEAIRRISQGEEPAKAFLTAAQTDGPTLFRALKRYFQGRTDYVRIHKSAAPAVGLSVTTLPESAENLLLEAVRLNDEVDAKEAPELLDRVRRRAGSYPDDLFAQLVLARAEVTIGDLKKGLAILDGLLAKHPENVEFIREAAHAQMSRGERVPTERQVAFRAARPLFGKAYQKDPRDFRTLYGYAQARAIEPDYPNDNALEVLLLARELAPSVDQVSLQIGAAFIQRGKSQAAARFLTPIANNPHGGEASERAKALLAGAKPQSEDLKGEVKAEEGRPAA